MTDLSQWLSAETEDQELASVIVSMADAGVEIAAILRQAPELAAVVAGHCLDVERRAYPLIERGRC